MLIRQADINDLSLVTDFTLKLYDDDTYENLLEENRRLLTDNSQVIYLIDVDGSAAGFAHCALRYDYVEGTDGGNVGYLEGIYILPGYRKKGMAQALVSKCEDWAREKGCGEFASDCELDNTDSYNFHLAIGFEEANRIICFTKKIK